MLDISELNNRLDLPDKRLIALCLLKRKVRALQGHSAR